MQLILGQDHALDLLQSALASGRIHHAWIFHGPRGVGKCTTALEFAKILLDRDAMRDDAGRFVIDPAGATSRAVDAGTHPDLHVIRKEDALYADTATVRNRKLRNIPLDLIRERMLGGRTGDGKHHEAAAYRTAVRGAGKVFIIDEAELLEPVGQNAMLKTLEEPPRQTFIFLVTTRPERLLPTVRSRCHLVRFDRLSDEAMDRWMASADLPEIDEAASRWIRSFSAGSPGQATLAATYDFHAWQRAVEPMLAALEQGRFPAEMGETLAALVESFAKAWVKDHKNASKDAANKDGARHLLGLLASHARARLQETIHDGDDPEPWTRGIELIRAAEQQMERSVNLKIVLANLVVQWGKEEAGIGKS